MLKIVFALLNLCLFSYSNVGPIDFAWESPKVNEESLRQHYDEFLSRTSNDNALMPLPYETFVNYYLNSSGLTLDDFTATLISEYCHRQNNPVEELSDHQIERSSNDAFYILKDGNGGNSISNPYSTLFDPVFTPYYCFQQFPSYTSFDFSSVKKGDIILETAAPDFGMGHAAIVYDTHKFYETEEGICLTYIQTIEAVGGGVQFGFLDTNRINQFGVMILRTLADDDEIEDCLDFIYAQLGKPYNYPFEQGRINTSINSTEWYCSELVYAGYYSIGVAFDQTSSGWINPFDILWSSYVFPTCFSNTPDPVLVGKSGNTWSFKVYNRTGISRPLYYNSKLCFLGAGLTWSGLYDVVTVPNVQNNLFYYVGVDENLFATTAAFSFTANNKRMISCCKSLASQTLHFEMKKAVINV